MTQIEKRKRGQRAGVPRKSPVKFVSCTEFRYSCGDCRAATEMAPRRGSAWVTYHGNPCARSTEHGNRRFTLGGECVECCEERFARMDEKTRRAKLPYHPENKWRRQQATKNAARSERAAQTRIVRKVTTTDPVLAWLLAP